mmetsp:Transcript_8268/g.13517  ORF Transcript_8268/g.13517 Transcript_8268/m.13517 type:complete len:229 (-) Transcript_8268:103-789(-)
MFGKYNVNSDRVRDESRPAASSSLRKLAAPCIIAVEHRKVNMKRKNSVQHKDAKEAKIEVSITRNSWNHLTTRTTLTTRITFNALRTRKNDNLMPSPSISMTDSMTRRRSNTFHRQSLPTKKEELSPRSRTDTSVAKNILKNKLAVSGQDGSGSLSKAVFILISASTPTIPAKTIMMREQQRLNLVPRTKCEYVWGTHRSTQEHIDAINSFRFCLCTSLDIRLCIKSM